MPPKDDMLPAEEHPLSVADSPTADLPGYNPKSDPKEDPEKDPKEDDEDPEDDPTDYPTDRYDDDDDDEEEESFIDEADNEEEDKDEEEEEHPAPADSVPLPVHRVTARMSILSPLPQILSPPLCISPPPLPANPTYPLGYRAAMIKLRSEAPSTSHSPLSSIPPLGTPPLLPIPLPTSSPPFLLPSTSHREYILEVTLLPRERLYIALGPRFEVGEISSAPTTRPTGGFKVYYGFVGTLDDEIRQDPERGRLSREAWVPSMDASDTALAEVMSLRITMLAQQSEIAGLRVADHARQTQLAEALTLLKTLQTQMAAFLLSIIGKSRLKMALKRTTRSTPATTTTTTTTHVTNAQLKALIDQGIVDALAARDADRSRNGEQNHEFRTGVRRQAPSTHECTYQDFMKCKPLYFKDRPEKKMTDKYCPRGEIKKLEVELWNLKVKGIDVVSYNQCFQELALMCARMFPEESDKIERYIDGLPDMIYKSVMASKPNTMQDVIEFTT
nr:reverse transcriptase domain-containing protein [Tanacetum cinerariifolium]